MREVLIIDVGPDLPKEKGREPTLKFWDPLISPERLKLQQT